MTWEVAAVRFLSKRSVLMVVNATGTSFSVTDSKGVTYRIYASSSITLGASNDNIVASEKYNGVLRFAKLIDPSHQHLLDKHSATYPTSVGLDYSFTDVQGTLVFTWNTVGTGDLLMLTWPHHRLKMKNANFPPTSSLAYLTTKVPNPFGSFALTIRAGCIQRSAIVGACHTIYQELPGTLREIWMNPVHRR